MKTKFMNSHLVLCFFFLVIACTPPYKPNYNIAFGELIFKDICQNQQIYLIDVAHFQPYENGASILDTLTVYGVKYNHVIRLDSTKSVFLATRKVHDKLSINFLRGPRLMLPTCSVLPSGSVETVNVISAELTNY